MKILGCAKVVPDLDLLLEEDWTTDHNMQIDTSFVRRVWNCFDEGALQMMLEFSAMAENSGILFQLDAFTIGDRFCDSFLKTLYALGFNRTVRVETEEDWRFDSEKVAETIVSYVKKDEDISAVVMGCQAPEGNNYKTPLIAGEMMGWPCITEVIAIAPVDLEYLQVQSITDEGVLTQEIRMPCVLSVGNRGDACLRVPTLKARMQNAKKEICVIQGKELLEKDMTEKIELKNLMPCKLGRSAVKIEGGTPRDKAEVLFSQYIKGRLELL